jgi:hypothetical protein
LFDFVRRPIPFFGTNKVCVPNLLRSAILWLVIGKPQKVFRDKKYLFFAVCLNKPQRNGDFFIKILFVVYLTLPAYHLRYFIFSGRVFVEPYTVLSKEASAKSFQNG